MLKGKGRGEIGVLHIEVGSFDEKCHMGTVCGIQHSISQLCDSWNILNRFPVAFHLHQFIDVWAFDEQLGDMQDAYRSSTLRHRESGTQRYVCQCCSIVLGRQAPCARAEMSVSN